MAIELKEYLVERTHTHIHIGKSNKEVCREDEGALTQRIHRVTRKRTRPYRITCREVVRIREILYIGHMDSIQLTQKTYGFVQLAQRAIQMMLEVVLLVGLAK